MYRLFFLHLDIFLLDGHFHRLFLDNGLFLLDRLFNRVIKRQRELFGGLFCFASALAARLLRLGGLFGSHLNLGHGSVIVILFGLFFFGLTGGFFGCCGPATLALGLFYLSGLRLFFFGLGSFGCF